MKSKTERVATFENNSEVKETQNKSSRAFAKDRQWYAQQSTW